MNGQTIDKVIKPELTYREMDNINNIYSFLLLTGYLKVIEKTGDRQYKLIIPNREVYEIYKQSFMSYFKDYTSARKNELYQEFINGDARKVNLLLNDILIRSISYFDNQESFYHGFLVGLLNDYEVVSNKATNEYRETSLAKSRVIVRKPKVPVTESNYKVLQFLDLLKDVDVYSEVTGKPLQERLYQYMSDASLSLSEMEPYFSYYPDKLYKNLVETRVIYNGILAQ
jgi:hypothetical protein